MRLIIFFVLIVPSIGSSQLKFEWAIGGISQNTAQIMNVHLLPDGDGLFGAMFGSDIVFNGRQINQLKTQYPYNNVILGRVRPNGKTKWLLELCKSDNHAMLADMSVDNEGNIWAIGTYDGGLKFADGSAHSTSNYSAWVAKVSQDGELLIGYGLHDLNAHVHMYQIQAVDDGGCFITINYHGGTFGNEKLPPSNQGQYAQLVSRLDQTGKPLWVTPLSGPLGAISASDMRLNASGQVLVCGNFRYVSVPPETRVSISSTDTSGYKVGTGIDTENWQSIGGNGNIHGFIATLDPENGSFLKFEAVMSTKHINIRKILPMPDGSRILAFSNYGNFNYQGKTIRVNRINATTIVCEKNRSVLWHKVYDVNEQTYVDDLEIGNKCVYASIMIGRGKFVDGPVSFEVKELWAGTVLKYDMSGQVLSGDHFEVGRLNSVSMLKDKGYAGGWFHYDTRIGRDNLKAGKDGEFNMVLVGIGDLHEPEDSLSSDSLLIITGGLPDDILRVDSVYETRETEVQHTIEVSSSEIELAFWDDQRVDGDVISVFYNGRPVLENYVLTKKPRVIRLKVEADKPNYIVMYTKDLGSIPPTTTAVRISDEKQSQNISLRSDPDSNGTIEIVFRE